ncbi:MAG: hypothetical protein AB7I13_07870 [Vicinamibacterales bacterium]
MRPRLVLRAFGWAIMTIALSTAWTGGALASQPSRPERSLTPLSGGLYLVRDGDEHTVFLYTPDGIVLADPLSREGALWLREQMSEMFPRIPVKFVLLTGHELARIEGASVFPDATVVAHRSFNDAVAAARRSSPPGSHRFVRDVRTTYDERHVVTLAGEEVALIHVPFPGTPDRGFVHFATARVLFVGMPAVDVEAPRRLPVSNAVAASAWLTRVTASRFDTYVTAEGRSIDASQVRLVARYFGELVNGVARAVEQGESADRILATPLLRDFAGRPELPDRSVAIPEAFRSLRVQRTYISGGGGYGAGTPPSFCAAYTTCEVDTRAPRFAAGLRVAWNRIGLGLEASFGPQFWSVRTSRAHDEEFAQRQVRVSAVARWDRPRPRGLTIAYVAGLAVTQADTRGLERVKGVAPPTGGRFPIQERLSRPSVVLGIDFGHRWTERTTLLLPVRFTSTLGASSTERWVSRTDLQIGASLSYRVRRILR